MPASLIEISNLSKTYSLGNNSLAVLKEVTFCVGQGDFLAVMGPSGSGKSTLLNIVGCLDRPTSGTYALNGVNISHASDNRLSEIRASVFGFVFQSFNLISNLNVYDNVSMPFLYSENSKKTVYEKTMRAIKNVGLSNRILHNPDELSGGEMQRVAIARALVRHPKIILADEPTGNLDSGTGTAIMKLLKDLNNSGTSLVLVTHDTQTASWAGKIMTLKDGKFV